jgi:hypothetical protein
MDSIKQMYLFRYFRGVLLSVGVLSRLKSALVATSLHCPKNKNTSIENYNQIKLYHIFFYKQVFFFKLFFQ